MFPSRSWYRTGEGDCDGSCDADLIQPGARLGLNLVWLSVLRLPLGSRGGAVSLSMIMMLPDTLSLRQGLPHPLTALVGRHGGVGPPARERKLLRLVLTMLIVWHLGPTSHTYWWHGRSMGLMLGLRTSWQDDTPCDHE